MDFRCPSIGDICNFLWLLFNTKNRCPSTIEGYRTAIADTLGNSVMEICNNADIARLIASFHRDRPKSAGTLPKWDLNLVLHQLSMAPYEPLEQGSIKFLTWKTVFLLALASGKMCSEIHAWMLDGLLRLGNWDQIKLTPSPSFIAKNQLVKEGPQAVSPAVIPALKSDFDSQDMDTTVCHVRALAMYLEKSKLFRGDKTLLFISYK